MTAPEAAAAASVPEPKECRFCLAVDSAVDERAEEDAAQNGYPPLELIVPCKCDGTARYVHRMCLEKSRAHGSASSCAVCHAEYQLDTGRTADGRYRHHRLPCAKCVTITLFGFVLMVVFGVLAVYALRREVQIAMTKDQFLSFVFAAFAAAVAVVPFGLQIGICVAACIALKYVDRWFEVSLQALCGPRDPGQPQRLADATSNVDAYWSLTMLYGTMCPCVLAYYVCTHSDASDPLAIVRNLDESAGSQNGCQPAAPAASEP
jgi:hypothetical protein